MGVTGGAKCIKYLMFIFNIFFWLIGVALLGFGIWALVDPNVKKYAQDLTDKIADTDKTAHAEVDYYVSLFRAAAIVVIVVGALVMITGFLACCGAIRESQCMLATYCIILFIFVAALIALGIYYLVTKGKVVDNLECCGYDTLTRLTGACCTKKTYNCTDAMLSWISDNMILIGGVVLGLGVFMILCIVFALCLCCAIKD